MILESTSQRYHTNSNQKRQVHRESKAESTFHKRNTENEIYVHADALGRNVVKSADDFKSTYVFLIMINDDA